MTFFHVKTPPPVLQTTVQSEEVTVNAPIKSVPAPIKQKVQLEITSHNIIAPNTVVEQLPEMETFEVELVKDQQGLGITIAGYVCEKGIILIKSTVFLSISLSLLLIFNSVYSSNSSPFLLF